MERSKKPGDSLREHLKECEKSFDRDIRLHSRPKNFTTIWKLNEQRILRHKGADEFFCGGNVRRRMTR